MAGLFALLRMVFWPLLGTPQEMQAGVPWKRAIPLILIGLAMGTIVVLVVIRSLDHQAAS